MKKIFIIFFTLFHAVFSFEGFVFARELEIDYPPLKKAPAPQDTAVELAEYVRYIYSFVVYSAAAIGLLFLIIGGVSYLLSSGDPSKIKASKKIILKAFLGLVIILSSSLLLGTISSDFNIMPSVKMSPIAPITGEDPVFPPDEPDEARYSPKTVDLLERVDSLVKEIKKESSRIEKLTYDLRDAANLCDCSIGGKAICEEI